MINNTKEKRCPKGTRKDPKTNECVPYIKSDKKISDSKYQMEKAMGHGVRNQTEFIITNDFLYNTKNNYTRTDYNAVKLENLKQVHDKLHYRDENKEGRKFIKTCPNKISLIDAILEMQNTIRIKNGIEPEYIPEVVKNEETEQFIQPINESIFENSVKIPSFIIDKADTSSIELDLGDIPENNDTPEYNDYLKKKEKTEYDENKTKIQFNNLYPTYDDPNFSSKISLFKEFDQTKYDGEIRDIETHANNLCDAEVELSPHQMFVKNFMSNKTPYNGLLLYHGVGTGKTCSAIGIAEEHRKFTAQHGNKKRTIVVASPNVQVNFKNQLFDETKLDENNGIWSLQKSCVGNDFLKEINPSNTLGLQRDFIVRQIKGLVNNNYVFMGYTEFSRYIQKKIKIDDSVDVKTKKKLYEDKIQKLFNDRLVIIDEVHNIRVSDDNKQKQLGRQMINVAKYSNNMKLLLLSATPMYNSHREIIWIINLLNSNDNRSILKIDDIFKKDGAFTENGEELLHRKLVGYVSYIRGENPYSFPFRIYPEYFEPNNKPKNYPTKQFNNKEIINPVQHIPLYYSNMGEFQATSYKKVIRNLTDSDKISFENMEAFGYTLLQKPIEATTMIYPSIDKDHEFFTGKSGLQHIMNFKTQTNPKQMKYDYGYKPDVLEKYGNIFALDKLKTYSGKLFKIGNAIKKSQGVILIYSQYIEGGVIPTALMLEELGFKRYTSNPSGKSLFKDSPTDSIDYRNYKSKSTFKDENDFKQARYCMITGDVNFSYDNDTEIKKITSKENKDGELIKVVIISKAASEGIDFKFIRQVHIIEPWYNMNRIEQIIGRAVRQGGHCFLPFKDRNVEIYLHVGKDKSIEHETPDLYLYRLAENKAIQIGNITRILKNVSVDCVLNIGQTNFTIKRLQEQEENKQIKIKLSSGKLIDFKVGDRPYTELCDYKDNCSYKCLSTIDFKGKDIINTNYTNEYAVMNYNVIVKRIKTAFILHNIYKKDDLINEINSQQVYPTDQILYVLSQMVDHKSELISDSFGRTGTIINKDKYYAFQPMEINDESISILERSKPIDYKHSEIVFKDRLVEEPKSINQNVNTYKKIFENIQTIIIDINKPLDKKPKSNDDFYKHASYSKVYHICINILKIPKQTYQQFILYHFIDECNINDKLLILKEIYFTKRKLNDTEKIFVQYFDNKLVYLKKKKCVLLYHLKKNHLYEIAEDSLKEVLINESNKKLFDEGKSKFKVTDKTLYYSMIGFLNKDKNDNLIIKIKDIVSKTYINYGVNATSLNKEDLIKRIGCVLDAAYCKTILKPVTSNDIVNDLNAFLESKSGSDTIKSSIVVKGFSVILELICRYNDVNSPDGKRYFFDLETSYINNVLNV